MREKHDSRPTTKEAGTAFGVALRRHRVTAGLTQDALAEASGLTTQYVSMLERGVNQPSFLSIVTLAAGLGVAAADLVGDASKQLETLATERK